RRAHIVEALRHNEGLVRSAKCEFTWEVAPTDPGMAPLIRQVFADRGAPEEAVHYHTSKKAAEKQSYKAVWWRDGQKERVERYPLNGDTSGEAETTQA